ncbi:hypothetical protein BN1088_1430490 [Sphingobacterium sp. PM2-P1-29]|nr:hypothetical protein BN1088_1430490 [Sphingobacterium sp. PM2-P1-29]
MKKLNYFIFVFLIICLPGCKKEIDFSIDDSFEFSLEDTAGIILDKNAVIKLSVKKLVDTKKGFTVEFKTDKGTLTAQNIKFEEKFATTYLRLDENESVYYLTANIKDENSKLVTEKSIVYKPNSFKDSFEFVVSDSSGVQADGNAEIRLTVIGKSENYDGNTVAFTSNNGNILLPEVSFQGNTAISYFKVPKSSGKTYITATVKKENKTIATKSVVFNLDNALPSFIFLSGNKATYNMSDPIQLQTVLFDQHQTTHISEGLRVTFSAYQLSSANLKVAVGNFENALDVRTDSQGKIANVNFSADSRVDTTKNIFIECITSGPAGHISNTAEFSYFNE